MNLKAKLKSASRLLTAEFCVVPSVSASQALASTQGFDCAPLVRVVGHNPSNVKVALDLGAEGIVFLLVKTVEDAKACVASTRYPPDDIQGWGPFIGHSRWSVEPFEYLPHMGDKIVCRILIDTVEAIDVVDEIFSLDGVGMAFVAPFDLSTSLGISGQIDHPTFLSAVAKIEAPAKSANMPLGGVAIADTQDKVRDLRARGCRIFADFDVLQLKRAAKRLVDDVSAVAANG